MKNILLFCSARKILSYIFLLLLTILLPDTFAQNVSITVLDSVNFLPISSAYIFSDSNQYVTNSTGKVELNLTLKSKHITIHHISYISKRIEILPSDFEIYVFLIPANYIQDTILIISKKENKGLTNFSEVVVFNQRLNSGTNSVGDLISNTSLLIKDYGGVSGLKTASLRGMGAENLTVLFNEVAVNDLRTGSFDLSEIPSFMIDKIELLKGASSESVSSMSLGTLKINTKENIKENNISSGAKISSLRQNSFFIKIDEKINKFSFSSNFERSYSPNRYNYNFEGKLHERENAFFSKTFLSSDAKVNLEQISFRLYAHYSFSFSGTPGFVVQNNYNSSSAKNQSEAVLLISNAEWTINKNVYLKSNASYRTQSLFMSDPDKILFRDRIDANSKLKTGSFSINPIFDLKFGKIIAGYDFIFGNVNDESIAFLFSDNKLDYTRYLNRLSLSYLADGKFNNFFFKDYTTTLSYNFESSEEQGGVKLKSNQNSYYAFNFGVATSISGLEDFQLKFNYQKYSRIPTINERYYSGLFNNSNLNAERYSGFDLGFIFSEGEKNKITWSVAYFYYLANDKIIWLPIRLALQVPKNISKVISNGFETEIYISLFNKFFEIKGNYSYTDSRNVQSVDQTDLAQDKFMVYSPLHHFNISTTISYSNFSFNIAGHFVSERYYTTDNDYSNKLYPYFISDMVVNYNFSLFGKENNINLFINNLFNSDYFVIQSYPMPKTNYLITYGIKI